MSLRLHHQHALLQQSISSLLPMLAVEMCHKHSVESIVSSQAINNPIFSRVMSTPQALTVFNNVGACRNIHRAMLVGVDLVHH